MNAVTRYLCSSVYLDLGLRNKVLELFNEKYKCIAEPFGVDVLTLFKHALNAEKRQKSLYVKLFIFAILILISVFIGLFYNAIGLPVAFVFFLITVAILFRHLYTEETTILRDVFKESGDPDKIVNLDDEQLRQLAKKKEQISEDLVYYDGFYPFVGSGIELENWSFTIDIDKGKRDFGLTLEPQDFTVSELNYFVRNTLNELEFINLTVTEKGYLNGKKIRNKEFVLPNILSHPKVKLDNSLLKKIKSNSYDCRFYNQIAVYDWNDELILNIYLRFCKTKRSLFIEANYFLLTPVSDKYKRIDAVKQNFTFTDNLALFLQCFLGAPFYYLVSIGKILSMVSENGNSNRDRSLRKEVEENPNFNYGTSTSIRELVSQPHYDDMFQKLDKEMYAKTLEKRILSSIMDFLEQRNIDISEFKQREQSILNNGVIMTGGNMKAENMSVGKNAKTTSFFRRDKGSSAT
jgi:hypothetical protein